MAPDTCVHLAGSRDSMLRGVHRDHRSALAAWRSTTSFAVEPKQRSSGEPPSQEAAIRVVRWMTGTTVYESLGDGPCWLSACLVLGMGLVSRGRKGTLARLAVATGAR